MLFKKPLKCYFNNLKHETASATDAWSLALFFLILADWIKDCLHQPCSPISLSTISPLCVRRVQSTPSEVKYLSWKYKTKTRSLSWPKHNPSSQWKTRLTLSWLLCTACFQYHEKHCGCFSHQFLDSSEAWWKTPTWVFVTASHLVAIWCLLFRGFLINTTAMQNRQLIRHTNWSLAKREVTLSLDRTAKPSPWPFFPCCKVPYCKTNWSTFTKCPLLLYRGTTMTLLVYILRFPKFPVIFFVPSQSKIRWLCSTIFSGTEVRLTCR